MSLASQVDALAARIATEFNTVRTEIGSGGGGSGVPVYVQQTQPAAPAIWFQTDADGFVVDILRVT